MCLVSAYFPLGTYFIATPMIQMIGSKVWNNVTVLAVQFVVVAFAIVPMAIGPKIASKKKETAIMITSRIPKPIVCTLLFAAWYVLDSYADNPEDRKQSFEHCDYTGIPVCSRSVGDSANSNRS